MHTYIQSCIQSDIHPQKYKPAKGPFPLKQPPMLEYRPLNIGRYAHKIIKHINIYK
jgi:hypothetical protein